MNIKEFPNKGRISGRASESGYKLPVANVTICIKPVNVRSFEIKNSAVFAAVSNEFDLLVVMSSIMSVREFGIPVTPYPPLDIVFEVAVSAVTPEDCHAATEGEGGPSELLLICLLKYSSPWRMRGHPMFQNLIEYLMRGKNTPGRMYVYMSFVSVTLGHHRINITADITARKIEAGL